METFLVTGCAGFIGSSIAEALLKRGYKVIGIDAFLDNYPRAIKEYNLMVLRRFRDFIFLEADIMSLDLDTVLRKVDYIIHEAAQPGVRSSWGNMFDSYVRNNILATQKLLEACIRTRPKKFVFASSSSVYGNAKRYPIREDDPLNPVSPYGVTKLAAEKLCLAYTANFDIPLVCLRYFTVYGPRQRPDMAIHRFLRSALLGQPIVIYGDGTQARDFTYVEDVVNATIEAALSDIEGTVLNIGSGNPVRLLDLVKHISDILGQEVEVIYDEEQKGDVKTTFADISRAQKLLGYSPQTDLEDGLRAELDWIKTLYTHLNKLQHHR